MNSANTRLVRSLHNTKETLRDTLKFPRAKITQAFDRRKQSSDFSAASPLIDELPIDLLSDIFLLISREARLRWTIYHSRRETTRIMLVCKKWQMIVLSTSQLWADIDMKCPRLVPMFLERSGKASMNVIYDPVNSHYINIDYLLKTWQLVLLSSQRIVSLCLQVPSTGNLAGIYAIVELLGDPDLLWPRLSSLELCIRRIDKASPVPLTPINVTEIHYFFTSPAFGPRLQRLHLESISIPMSTLFLVLKQCSQLRELDLTNIALLSSAEDQWQEKLDSIPLSCLERLRIRYLTSRYTHLLLEHLNVPDDVLTHLTVKEMNDLFPLMPRALARFSHKSILNIAIGTCRAFMTRTRSYDGISSQDIDSISIAKDPLPDGFSHVLSTFGSANCQVLAISCPDSGSSNLTAIQWQSVLGQFPGLKHLCLGNQSPLSMLVMAIRALGLSSDTYPQTTLPRLERITVDFNGAWKNHRSEWDEISAGLKRLCEQSTRINELRVVCRTLSHECNPKKDKEWLERLLGSYVGNLDITYDD